MKLLMTPGGYLLLAVGGIIAACSYFEAYQRYGDSAYNGVGGIACGFLIVTAAALLGAAHLHRK